MPFAGWIGLANVAPSSILPASKIAMSAAIPRFSTPRSLRPKVRAVSPVILYTAVSRGEQARPTRVLPKNPGKCAPKRRGRRGAGRRAVGADHRGPEGQDALPVGFVHREV